MQLMGLLFLVTLLIYINLCLSMHSLFNQQFSING